MKIYTAQVKSSLDVARMGIIQITCTDEPRATEAYYTTPYHKPFRTGGMFAIPAENSNILIAFDDKNLKAYYLSTIIDADEAGKANNVAKSLVQVVANPVAAAATGPLGFLTKPLLNKVADKLFKTPIVGDQTKLYEGFAPAVMKFKNDEDNGLSITDKNAKKYMVNETRLNSGGKYLSLNSSPEIDCVHLDNGHGDFLKITGMPQSAVGLPPDPKRSLQAKTFLSQEFVSDRGGIDLRVVEGKDINIENDSTGFMSVGGVGGFRSGNVNIFSKWKNIRLAAKGFIFPPNVGGQIILETALSKIFTTNLGIAMKAGLPVVGASLEMDAATGTVVIKNTISKIIMTNIGISLRCGLASIELTPAGVINLTAPLGINLITPGINTTSQSLGFSPGAVNIGGPTSIVNIQGSVVNMQGAAVNIDGETGIFLNTGQATVAGVLTGLLDIPFTPPTPANPPALGTLPIVPAVDVEYPSGSKFPV